MGQKNFKPRHRESKTKSFNGRKNIDKMYGREWEAYRARFLSINKECYSCGRKSEVVDHLVPHKGDASLFKNTTNHIPLCIKCHNTVTGLFDKNYHPGDSIESKVKWLNDRRIPTDNWTPKKVKVLSYYGK